MLATTGQIAIIGLGYVGLPLALAFAEKYKVLGFDIDKSRIEELKQGCDRTGETNILDLKAKKMLAFSSDVASIADCNIYIVTVPTPIDAFKKPDLGPLLAASKMLGRVLKKGDVVVYESTVYPGCTEEDCVPVLEKYSKLKYNKDFFIGYSPERINPGDKVNTITKIKKVVSGSTPEVATYINELYASIIEAGTHLASSIKVAEAAKAIENAQRDVNISFMNELALIFDKLNIDTQDVIEAASTKWNFLRFTPGLVGGHCIGVDPYYLSYKAEQVGYSPQVILSGRRVNDQMGAFVANKVVKMMIAKDRPIKHARALILGLTFKENCSDIRNTRIVDIYTELKQFGLQVDVYDPWASKEIAKTEYGISLRTKPEDNECYDVIILAVAHDEFNELNYRRLKSQNGILFDCKSVLDKSLVDARL